MATKKLTEKQVRAALDSSALAGWELVRGKLHREYRFPDFVHAFGFMAMAAVAAEAMGHHPEWSNVYNKVSINLVTHDAGGVSALDLELAEKLEALAERLLRDSEVP